MDKPLDGGVLRCSIRKSADVHIEKKSELTNLDITHISLVKAGANKKSILYKSVETTPLHEKVVKVAKVDEEGVIYGIVYAPNEVDTQGEFATAPEIKKAAYKFMKAQNILNVDQNHDFENRDAYIAESWILKEGDPVFPKEPAGAWAVAIALESEALRKQARDGDIAGISMAGTATKTQVEKATPQETKNLVAALTDAFKEMWIEIRGVVSKEKENTLDLKDIDVAVKKAMEPVAKEMQEQRETIEAQAKEITTLKAQNEEMVATLKKSRQTHDTKEIEKSEFSGKGVL